MEGYTPDDGAERVQRKAIDPDTASDWEMDKFIAYEYGWRVYRSDRIHHMDRPWFINAPVSTDSTFLKVGYFTENDAWQTVFDFFAPTSSVEDGILVAEAWCMSVVLERFVLTNMWKAEVKQHGRRHPITRHCLNPSRALARVIILAKLREQAAAKKVDS